MLKNILFAIALTLALGACSRVKNNPPADSFEAKELTKREISPETLTLMEDTTTVDYAEELEEGLFGKFFGDRAEFFIVKNPENKLYDEQINLIVLSFLDGQLCQTKYHVDKDISDKLIRKFGNFYIAGFDQANREILQKEGAGMGDSSVRKLIKKLTNYELTWRFNSKDIKFRVNKDDVKAPFQYVERLANYENLFKKIELAEN